MRPSTRELLKQCSEIMSTVSRSPGTLTTTTMVTCWADWHGNIVFPSSALIQTLSEAGALMSYAFDLKAGTRRVAAQIVEILNGGKPEEMPYFMEAHFELVINLKAAKEIGLEIPAGLIAQADRVIE
jgi:ABC transporter substrate binding protein